ncbi:alpha/beta fold hydrolase [Nitriliruptor alkaliphilus]|uniref:alpha/beta fold hydrolase n=1 Tax=Nitriliruptor alkaliphilus TaxID=427918 RepID=UPI000697DA22|nr:alpha/beta hydrolase [Nitriliruptor alkaliphilus]
MVTRQVAVPGADLEVVDWGAGEPVVFVQTALVADELLPLADHPRLAEGYRKILYHRRGYAGSGPVTGPGSIVRDAADCRALLEAFGIPRAHIVGASLSGAIALQLAADAPACVHSLTLLEPPPVHTASAPDFRAANDRLLQSRQERGLDAALDEFLGMVIGPRWREEIERHVPGAADQMERDVRTFFDTDLAALLEWRFDRDDAGRIGAPLMHIGGSDSGPWFAEVRQLILEWLPHAEDVVIDGADHSLAITHTPQVAEALAAFLRSHPLDPAAAR